MGDIKQVVLLNQSVRKWNQWRKKDPNKKVDLSEADLSKANLSGANLRKVNLYKANLSKANLSKADLSMANLSEANLSEANLNEANLSMANLSEANLNEANLGKANLSEANLRGAWLSYSCLSQTSQLIVVANLREADLSLADLREADLCGAALNKANLSKANLCSADLSQADLSQADLCKTDLREADLSQANLTGAYLVQADLSRAIITGAQLYGTAIDDSKIDGIFCEYVFWDAEHIDRTPKDRKFRPGEFEELYRQLPTFEYVFEHGFTVVDTVVMARVVNAINEQYPEFMLDLVNFDKRGKPHASFTVLHKDHVEAAKAQVATIYEQRISILEAQKEQLMEVVKMLGSGQVMLQPFFGGMTIHQTLSPDLTQTIVAFLETLPCLEREDARIAWVFSAGLDTSLQQQIQISGPPVQFFQLLVETVVAYGKMKDGRLAIEEILNAAKVRVGSDRQAYCDQLIQQIHSEINIWQK